MTLMKTVLAGLGLAAALAVATPAAAASVTLINGEVDGTQSLEALVAEGRIGRVGVGDTEVVLGETASASDSSRANFDWANGQSYSFSYAFNGASATFAVNGTQVTYTPDATELASLAGWDGFFVRTRGTASSTVAISNLTFTGSDNVAQALGGITTTGTTQHLVVSGLGVNPLNGFTFTGNVAFSWTGNRPQGSALAFQIKAADILGGGDPSELAEPGTWGVILVGLAGMALVARRRALAA